MNSHVYHVYWFTSSFSILVSSSFFRTRYVYHFFSNECTDELYQGYNFSWCIMKDLTVEHLKTSLLLKVKPNGRKLNRLFQILFFVRKLMNLIPRRTRFLFNHFHEFSQQFDAKENKIEINETNSVKIILLEKYFCQKHLTIHEPIWST